MFDKISKAVKEKKPGLVAKAGTKRNFQRKGKKKKKKNLIPSET